MQVQIDKHIPSPKAQTRAIRKALLRLKPGHSCFVPGMVIQRASNILVWLRKQAPSYRYSSATEGEGVRIWRDE